jgi:hypothetical protein
LKRVSSAVNPSDASALSQAKRQMNHDYGGQLMAQKQLQMDKLLAANNNAKSVSSETLQALRNRFDALMAAIPERQRQLDQQMTSLEALETTVATVDAWLSHAEAWLKSAEQLDALNLMLASLDAKEGEMTELMEETLALKRQAQAKGFNLVSPLETKLVELNERWQRLISACRQTLSKQQLEERSEAELAEESLQQSHRQEKNEEIPVPKERMSLTRKDQKKDEKEKDEQKASKEEKDDHDDDEEAWRMRAPAIYASLRDHRDWVRRKRSQLAALTLAGESAGVQRQADDLDQLRSVDFLFLFLIIIIR